VATEEPKASKRKEPEVDEEEEPERTQVVEGPKKIFTLSNINVSILIKN
jgi:hypothetical protein